MPLRTPLTAQPHLYIGDSTGRPLDYGRVYFGEPNKDPEFYPIDIYLDPEMTIAAAQPIRTKGGFMDVGGDLAELHAAEVIYSLKVLDQYGRQIFYKPEMYRNNVSDFLVDEITRATAAEKVLTDNLSSEVTRATETENTISESLTTEVIRATNAEQTLDNKFTQANTMLDSKISSVAGGKKSYTTYAKMTGAAALPAGDPLKLPANSSVDVIADSDSTKNGTYDYDGTTFTKSAYDPATLAKTAAMVEIKENIGSETYGQSAFNIVGGYNLNGQLGAAGFETTRRTPQYKVYTGETVRVTTDAGSTAAPKGLFFDNNGVFVKAITSSTANTGLVTYQDMAPQDGFFVGQCVSSNSTGCSVIIAVGESRFTNARGLNSKVASLSIVTQKANTIKTITYDDLVLGYVNLAGDEVVSTTQARSLVYKFEAGTVVTLARKDNTHIFGHNTSATEKVGHDGSLWTGVGAPLTLNITITADKPYLRFFVRNSAITTLDLAAAKATVTLSRKTPVAYVDDINSKLSTLTTKVTSLGMMEFNSLYRTPSRAMGGVVSFIDDDGRAAVLSTLQPLLKSNNIPFAAAIIANRIDTTGYLTLSQLKELAKDTDGFEVMSHTFNHGNLVNLLTTAEKEADVYKSKQWFVENNFAVNGFVLPYGADDATVRRIVQKYYPACYDFDGTIRAETFATIKNSLISRSNWGIQANRLDTHKALVDQAVANNGWLVVTTHVGQAEYWDANSQADLQALIDYIKTKNMKVMLPRDGFQTFGNIVDNDSGFKIQANGVIVPGV